MYECRCLQIADSGIFLDIAFMPWGYPDQKVFKKLLICSLFCLSLAKSL